MSGVFAAIVWFCAATKWKHIADRELFNGHPSGSGMPLVWAHAEFLKLMRSLHDGKTFDTPAQTVLRYAGGKISSPFVPWRFDLQSHSLPSGKTLRIEVRAPGFVRWSGDNWATFTDTPTRDTDVGLFLADVPTDKLPSGAALGFTFYWKATNTWEGQNFTVKIA